MSMTDSAAQHKADDAATPARHRPASSYDRRVQIAAAKARVSIDKRLHVATPQWIVDLSKEQPE